MSQVVSDMQEVPLDSVPQSNCPTVQIHIDKNLNAQGKSIWQRVKSEFSPHSKAILVISLLSALSVIAVESYIANVFITLGTISGTSNLQALDPNQRNILVYLLVFVLAQVYQFGLLFDSIYFANVIQLIGHLAFCFATFLYSCFQYWQIESFLRNAQDFDVVDPVLTAFYFGGYFRVPLIAIVCILGLSSIAYISLSYYLYLEFGWSIYKKIGADIKIKRIHFHYQVFFTLLKLNYFFMVTFLIQYLVLLNLDDPEFWISVAGLPIGTFLAYLAARGLQEEVAINLKVWIALLSLSICYFLFKLIRLYLPTDVAQQKYRYSVRFLTFFACLSLLLLFASLVNTVICLRNIGKGLKQQIELQKRHKNDPRPKMPLF